MKLVLVLLSVVLGVSAQAKLSDFNSIIDDNARAQNQLHANLTNNLKETKIAVQKESKERFVVDSSGTINVPTGKKFLTFAKEKNFFRASEKLADKRLAAEVDSAE